MYTSYIPSPALGLHLRPTEFVVSVKYRLGLDIFLSEGKCTACPHQSDKLGDHAVSQAVMSKHVEDEHRIKKRNNFQCLTSSPSNSPPRKKENIDLDNFTESKENVIEEMEVEVNADDFDKMLLVNKIKDLESTNKDLTEQNKKDSDIISKLKHELEDLKSINIHQLTKENLSGKISPIQSKHLKYMKGHSLKYNTIANGACSANGAAVAIHEDETEGPKVKRRLLNHIIDNYDEYYINKIGLPYDVTIGVGKEKKEIKIISHEQMIEFMKSDEALTAFSDNFELHALANLYNVNVHVFTYGGSGKESWMTIPADPNMAVIDEKKVGKVLPDIYFYHLYDNHYDLLIKDDSRIALLSNKKTSSKENNIITEDIMDISNEDAKEDVCKEDLLDITCYPCEECKIEFYSEALLEKHLNAQHKRINCDSCDETFESRSILDTHMIEIHSKKSSQSCWNCDDCEFVASCASGLMKHLQVNSHQPSKSVKDKRKVFVDYKQCYTCDMDFDGFYNLMNHRKEVHPSNKKCKYFLAGKCIHGNKCWYVHGENDIDKNVEAFNNFKCDICKEDLKGKRNFMMHKKMHHYDTALICEKNLLSKCPRSAEDCWFIHKNSNVSKSMKNKGEKSLKDIEDGAKDEIDKSLKNTEVKRQVFQKSLGNTFPPDQSKALMDLLVNLSNQVSILGEKISQIKV